MILGKKCQEVAPFVGALHVGLQPRGVSGGLFFGFANVGNL